MSLEVAKSDGYVFRQAQECPENSGELILKRASTLSLAISLGVPWMTPDQLGLRVLQKVVFDCELDSTASTFKLSST